MAIVFRVRKVEVDRASLDFCKHHPSLTIELEEEMLHLVSENEVKIYDHELDRSEA